MSYGHEILLEMLKMGAVVEAMNKKREEVGDREVINDEQPAVSPQEPKPAPKEIPDLSPSE